LVRYHDLTGKSLRKTGTERERERERETETERDRETGEQHKEVCFWLDLSRGFPPVGVPSTVPEAHDHTLGKLLLVWCSVIPGLVQERCPFMWSPEMLQAGVKSSCCHRPKNWLVGQRIDS
jgi:hypothetical protein